MPDLSPDTVAQIIASVAIGIIAILGSLGGARLGAREGARASLAATKAFAEETEQRQRASVRLRLRLEIDHNLANLRALRTKLIAAATPKSGDDDASAEEPKLSGESYAHALVHAAMPAWTREAWESVTALISPALDAKEIEQANHFYGQLETISGIREQLTVMLNEKPHMEDFFGTGPRSVQPIAFYQHAPGLASEVDKIMSDLLERGNSIAEA